MRRDRANLFHLDSWEEKNKKHDFLIDGGYYKFARGCSDFLAIVITAINSEIFREKVICCETWRQGHLDEVVDDWPPSPIKKAGLWNTLISCKDSFTILP